MESFREEESSQLDADLHSKCSNVNNADHAATAFEWLTSLDSLDAVLLESLKICTNSIGDNNSTQAARVLDVGCGSSLLGENLVEHQSLKHLVSQVVHVDKDEATIHAMQERWKHKSRSNLRDKDDDDDEEARVGDDRLLFLPPTDFTKQQIDLPSGSCHLIVDKSTLDCALCTDHAAAALLTEVYRLLRPDNGVYLVISFHHVDFLRPLLQDCPGADWELSFHVINREQSEQTIDADIDSTEPLPSDLLHYKGQDSSSSSLSAWSSGCFHPDDRYRRTVNAVLCRRTTNTANTASSSSYNELDRNIVYQHINDTIERWYRVQNPLLTEARRKALELAFVLTNDDAKETKGKRRQPQQYHQLDIPSSFLLLFTAAEREHLTYEHFLGDWHAFHDKHPKLPVDKLSFETAVAFLEEMQ